MPGVVRVGDFNTGGGVALLGCLSVTANGKSVVTAPSLVLRHPGKPICTKGAVKILYGSTSVTAGGKPVVYVGVIDSCIIHKRLLGSFDVEVSAF